MMLDGECWELAMLERHIEGTVSGFLPTPMKSEAGKSEHTLNLVRKGKSQMTLDRYVRMYPTARKSGILGGEGSRWMMQQKIINGEINQKEAEQMLGTRIFLTPRKLDKDFMNSKLETARGYIKNQNHEIMLSTIILTESNGGKLNPDWVEWLMGWPIAWTALQPLEMDKFLQWQQQHLSYLVKDGVDLKKIIKKINE
jgi:hypothetical protein